MSISERKPKPKPVRRIVIFTGGDRRRAWSEPEKNVAGQLSIQERSSSGPVEGVHFISFHSNINSLSNSDSFSLDAPPGRCCFRKVPELQGG
jgi:hypothetical protein